MHIFFYLLFFQAFIFLCAQVTIRLYWDINLMSTMHKKLIFWHFYTIFLYFLGKNFWVWWIKKLTFLNASKEQFFQAFISGHNPHKLAQRYKKRDPAGQNLFLRSESIFLPVGFYNCDSWGLVTISSPTTSPSIYSSEHWGPIQRFKTVARRPGVRPITRIDGT